MKKSIAALLIAVMLLSLLAGCTSGQEPTTAGGASKTDAPVAAGNGTTAEPQETVYYTTDGQAKTMGGEITMGMTFNADFFNPFYQGSAINYISPAMEPLAYFKIYDNSWKPCLADSWERDSETSLTIHLNKDAKWEDGTDFSAADVIATWDARAQYGTLSTIGSPVAWSAIDEDTVRIEWDAFSLQYEVWALCQHVYQAKAIAEHDTDWLNTNLVGTGPYKLTSFIPDQEIVFEKREDYWGEPCAIDKMTTLYIADPTALLASFVNGEIGSLSVRDATTMLQLQAEGFEPIQEKSTMGTDYYALIIAKDPSNPLYDAKVRQALYMHGVDWDGFAQICAGSLGYHSDMIGFPSMSYYKDTIEQSSYDPEKCKALLTEAGYPNGFDVNIYARSKTTVMATALQESLKQVGVTGNIIMIDDSLSFGKILPSDEYQSGILFGNFTYTAVPQMDRFIKHINPTATFGPACVCSEERMEAWKNAFNAKTQAEEDEWLYKFVDLYVHEESTIWPMYNTDVLTYRQPYYHASDYATTVSSGSDPHEAWVDAH